MYVIGLPLEVNNSRSVTLIVNNTFSISLLFHNFPLSLGFPPSIYIWSCQSWPLVSDFNKHCIYSFTNLAASEISFPSIFQLWIDQCSWTKKDNTHSKSMSHLTVIFWLTFSLSYTFCKCLTNISSIKIQSYSQSNSISTRLAHF